MTARVLVVDDIPANVKLLEAKLSAEYFGVVERFSVFAATGFNAALGIHLFCMKPKEIKE